MKKICSIVTALVMALTVFIVPGFHGAVFAEDQDEPEAVATEEAVVPEDEAEGEDSVEAAIAEMGAPVVECTAQTPSSLTFSWDAVEGATGYEYSLDNNEWTATEGTSYQYTGLSAETEYTVYFRAYATEGEDTIYSDAVTATGTTTKEYKAPAAPSFTGVKKGYTNLKFSWGAVSGADGYAYSRFGATMGNNKFRDNGTSTSFNWDGLKQRQKKVFYVVAYVEVPEGTEGAVKLNPDNKLVLVSKVVKKGATTNTKEHITKTKKSRGYIYKYYDKDGVYRGDSYSMWCKVKNTSSKTKYLIALDVKRNNLVIYKGKKGHWEVYKHVLCATGVKDHRTPKGKFHVFARKPSFNSGDKVNGKVVRAKWTCWYATRFKGACFFHSVLYHLGSKSRVADGKLGNHRSHGCVRLNINDARWIYNNIKNGTTVLSYNYAKNCSWSK